MEPSQVKAKIKQKAHECSMLKQDCLSGIGDYINYLKSISPIETKGLNITASHEPIQLLVTGMMVKQISLDSVMEIILDNGTKYPINYLPIEDIISLWHSLYYQSE